MGEDETALEEHFGEVAEAQLVAQPLQHDQADHITGILQAIKQGAGPLVELSAARPAAKAAIPQCRALRAFLCVH